jgi:UDP-N-acetylmuramate dehydrogenase
MKILENYDLTKLNTFGISAQAKFLAEVKSERDFLELIQTPEFKNNEKLFLGGGSNVLFTKDFNGIVVLNKLKGIEIIKENTENVWLKAMGGEWWNDLVLFSVEKGFWGIENLSLVPGTVGAAPVQNIGAYGAEVKDNLEEVEALDIQTGQKKIFSKKECAFGYRDSVFKNKLKGKYFITAVVFKLSKKKNKNTNYKALQDYLAENKLEIKSSKDASEIIADIRRGKLPDPKILGNAGSFFKNVYVDIDKLLELELQYSEVPSFEEGEKIKIPAGWLIEQCGWKGKRIGNVGVHEKQALVLVNYGGATGQEILDLANQIIDSVFQKFGLKLTPEVNLI